MIAREPSVVHSCPFALEFPNRIGDFNVSEHGYKHFMTVIKSPAGQSMPEVFTASPKCWVRRDEMDPLLPGLVNVHSSER